MQNKFKKLLALIGPGLFLIGYNIGTGSVTTMASAGSRWGMSLIWTVVLSCIFTFIGIWAFSRYTLATGETILYAIKKRFPFGRPIAFFIMSALIIAEFMGISGLMAIVVDILQEWISFTVGYSSWIIKLIITISLAFILFVILWRGQYQFLEKILAITVAIMGICFIATSLFIVPSWGAIISGLIPAIPKESNATLIIAGMAGTTFSSAMLFCRSITLKEKGWTLLQSGRARTDAIISVIAMFVLSLSVMICAAGTLYVISKPIEETIDMVRIIEPLAGNFAITLFMIGILITLIGPYLKTKPVSLMILTMALLAIILPLSIIGITVLLNQKHLGKYKATIWVNLGLFATIIFSFIMSYFGVVGIWRYF